MLCSKFKRVTNACRYQGYDLSNVANIQATLYEAFGSLELLPLVGMGYTVAQLSFVPLVRKLSDFSELRVLIVIGAIIFSVGAVVCGSATSMNAFVVGRIIKGVGGSFMTQTYVETLVRAPAERQVTDILGVQRDTIRGSLQCPNRSSTRPECPWVFLDHGHGPRAHHRRSYGAKQLGDLAMGILHYSVLHSGHRRTANGICRTSFAGQQWQDNPPKPRYD